MARCEANKLMRTNFDERERDKGLQHEVISHKVRSLISREQRAICQGVVSAPRSSAVNMDKISQHTSVMVTFNKF